MSKRQQLRWKYEPEKSIAGQQLRWKYEQPSTIALEV